MMMMGWLASSALALTPGWHAVPVRGRDQDVLRLPPKGAAKHVKVLFLPGDGGWRGVAREMAGAMAGSGYDVYAWDTKRYLTSFTRDGQTLRLDQVGGDFAAVRRLLAEEGDPEPVIVVGWSQGAALSVVAAASAEGKSAFSGVVALALPAEGALGWRWRDNVRALFGKDPAEPHFDTAPFLGGIHPMRTAILQAGRDRFTPASVSHWLTSHLRRPHHIRTLEDASHDFGPNRERLYEELGKALRWVTAPLSGPPERKARRDQSHGRNAKGNVP